jgi:tripartite-type tricarboxylate transporter receptor subunit TctC
MDTAAKESTMTAQSRCFGLGLLCLATVSDSAGSTASSQAYPAGPVRFITQMAAGSGTDPAMRVVIDHLGKLWGQQAVLVNQPGAGGLLAARAAHAAPPDGHTLYMAIASTFTMLPLTQRNLPFNVDDFVPVGFVGEVPIAIAVSPKLPINSVSELVALSKKQPGQFNLGVGIHGGVTHLTAELFRNRSGADLTTVVYAGGVSQAMSDVITGRVQVLVEGLAGGMTKGQLKLLAIASPTRVTSFPDIPTVAETVPDFVASGWFVLVAPPGTPASIVQKVRKDLYAVLSKPEVRQRLEELSVSTRPMSPEQLTAFIRAEQKLWRPVIDQLGLAK